MRGFYRRECVPTCRTFLLSRVRIVVPSHLRPLRSTSTSAIAIVASRGRFSRKTDADFADFSIVSLMNFATLSNFDAENVSERSFRKVEFSTRNDSSIDAESASISRFLSSFRRSAELFLTGILLAYFVTFLDIMMQTSLYFFNLIYMYACFTAIPAR